MTRLSPFLRKRALELYPSIGRAVPPKDIGPKRSNPLRIGEYPHSVANYFFQDQIGASRNLTAKDSAAIIGPIAARGECLYPFRRNGSEMWFDPTIAAEHGDVVLFQVSDDLMPSETEAERQFRVTMLGARLNFQCKLLVKFADEYWLAAREYMIPLGDIQILGVEVARPNSALGFRESSAVEAIAK